MRSIIHAAGSVSVGRPGFATRPYFAVRQILYLQLQAIPRIWLPGERSSYGARSFGLPGLQVKHLAVAVECQHITLCDHTGIALLPALLRCENICFDGVVREVGRSKVGSSATQK